jgi:hypothetical protein
MDEKENKLNLPAIRKTGTMVGTDKTTKVISKFDLNKKTSVASVLKTEDSSVEKDILTHEKGLDLVLVGDLTTSMTNYHTLLKNKFKELCSSLFLMIENLRIGIIFYLEPVQHLLSSSEINARTVICSVLCIFRSQFFHSRRYFSSHPNVRSTTHRFGSTANLCGSLRFTTSTSAPISALTALAKFSPL